MMGRRGRPGVLGVAARTAVVAGTASAVSNRVNRRAMGRAEQEAEARAYEQQQAAMAQQAAAQQAATLPPPPPAPAAPAASSTDDMIDALELLAALHAQGILGDEELAQAKAKILGG
jgi:hypothetical protein